MSGGHWNRDAPCRGDLRFTPADDAVDTLVDHKAVQPLALQLLAVCATCPFRAACVAHVLPAKSKFDGICGGRLWTNGTVRATCHDADPSELAEPGTYIHHGTEAGARAHNRRGEPACSLCAEAARLEAAERRRAKAEQQHQTKR